MELRSATLEDLPAITQIYNQAVRSTAATFDSEPVTEEDQKLWFLEHDEQFPVLVAEQDEHVVAWASLSEWEGRCTYSATAEASVYVEQTQRGQGIGTSLLTRLLEEGRRTGLRTVLGRIASGNEASIKMCRRLGLEEVGILRQVGEKFGQVFDVHLVQILFEG